MKILFIGEYKFSGGPSNVNRNLKDRLPKNVIFLKGDNKFIKIIELLLKILFVDVIIISGYSHNMLSVSKLAKKIEKKIIYIMHGCIEYENKINKLNMPTDIINKEILFLKNVDLILCVSERYMKWVKNYYKDISNKVMFLNNGIDERLFKNENKAKKEMFTVAVFGGNRIQKNNIEVCKALELINKENINVKLNVYGRIYENNDDFSKYSFVNIKGHISQEILYNEMKETDIFICNSEVESYGLSVIDALSCGCSILLSKNCGILSVLKVEDSDIINDPHNIKEISSKILNIKNKPNNLRITKNINFKENSWESSAKKLLDFCEEIVEKDKK